MALTFARFVHTATGLWLARCEQLPGLIVHGHSEEELAARIPSAARSYLRYVGGGGGEPCQASGPGR